MRVIRVLLLLLPLALCLTATVSAQTLPPTAPAEALMTQAQPAPGVTAEDQLFDTIFTPAPTEMVGPFYGYCAITCERCWGPGDCAKVGTRRNVCALACN